MVSAGRTIIRRYILKRLLLYFIFVLALYTNVFGGDSHPRFQQLSTKDGLSNNIVYTLLQDSKGYLWAGTYNGIDKYDGYSFIHYQHDPADKKSISNGPVCVLFEDHEKNIWIGTTTGKVCKYNPQTETFIPLEEIEKLTRIKKFGISTIIEDKFNNLWIGTYGEGLYKYNLKSKKFTKFGPANCPVLKQVISVFPDENGNLWIGTFAQGLLFYNVKKDSVNIIYSETTNLAQAISVEVQCFYRADKNRIILGTKNGWAIYNNKDQSIKRYYFKAKLMPYENNVAITSITKDKVGYYWLTTNHTGLFKFNIETGEIENFLNNPYDQYSLSSNAVKNAITDFSDNLWIATDEGINKLDAHRGNFKNYNTSQLNNPNPAKKGVRAIFQEKDRTIWLGTEGGLHKLTKNKHTAFNHDIRFTDEYYNNINTIYKDKSGRLWIGSPRGIQICDIKANKLIHKLYPQQDCWSQYATWAIFEDNEGIIWFGTQRKGLFSLNPETGAFISYGSSGNKKLIPESIWSIFQDSRNILWFGTNRGVYCLNKTLDSVDYKFQKLGNEKIQNKTLSGENAWWFHEDKQKNIWIATSDGGLNKVNPFTGHFNYYNTNNGLPSNALSAILEDKKGYFWISTVNGLCKFDPIAGKAIRNYHIEDGLQGNHFNFKSAWQNNNGEMFFGEQDGYVRFHPDSIAFNTAETFVTISSFKVLYNEAKKELLDDSSIVLPYTQNSFSFDFASLDLSNPEKNQFRYCLKGFDKEFIEAGTRHFISYTNLDPGEYVFLLKGTNSDGIWSRKDVSFHITILPPFWQTWWFRSLVASVLLGLTGTSLYLFFKRNLEKRKRVQSELAALRNQLNPHFVFNSLTSLQHFIIENQRNLAIDYLTKFAVLMRMILENSKQETISIEEEKKFLELYLYMEASRFEHKFGVKINVDPSLNEREIGIPPMLLQPVVENAIKHGLVAKKEDGKIEVSFLKRNNKSILCIVEDNGVGRKRAMESKAKSNIVHQSRSTEIINEKLQLISSGHKNKNKLNYIDLYDVSGNAIGTRAELEIPINA